MRIETEPNPVTTVDHNTVTVNVRIQEFVIKDDRPLSMIEFSVTMRHECAVRPLPANALRRKLCWHSKCRQWASRLVEGELRLATTPDEDPETDLSDVRLHGR